MKPFQYVLGGCGLLLTIGVAAANLAGPWSMQDGAERNFDISLALAADIIVILALWSMMEFHRSRKPILVFTFAAVWAVASFGEVTGARHWMEGHTTSSLRAADKEAAAADTSSAAIAREEQSLKDERTNLARIQADLAKEKKSEMRTELRRLQNESRAQIATMNARIIELSPKASKAGIAPVVNQWAGYELHSALALWALSQLFWFAAMLDLQNGNGTKMMDAQMSPIDLVVRPAPPIVNRVVAQDRPAGVAERLAPPATRTTTKAAASASTADIVEGAQVRDARSDGDEKSTCAGGAHQEECPPAREQDAHAQEQGAHPAQMGKKSRCAPPAQKAKTGGQSLKTKDVCKVLPMVRTPRDEMVRRCAEMDAQGVSQAEIARTLGVSRRTVQRALDDAKRAAEQGVRVIL